MKIAIIGAGATAYSRWANPNRRPPLSNKDLLRMFNKPAYRIPALDASYNHFFSSALKLYSYNIEALFTGIYMLANQISILEDEKVLTLKYLGRSIADIGTGKSAEERFSNILTIFQGKLLMEIQLCIGTQGEFPTQPHEMPVCPWHRKIATQFDLGDVVVNFNYDLVMPYALLNERKLSGESFLNSFIKKIDIPEKLMSKNPVTLLTPHGSFAWQMRKKLNYYDQNVEFVPSENFYPIMAGIKAIDLTRLSTDEIADLNFQLDPPHIRINLNNNFPAEYELPKVILPLQKKKQILDGLPHFKEEYDMFLNKLEQADEIYLIGKNFKSSDEDIATDIKKVCLKSKRKNVVYINPDIKYQKWIEHHNNIFNTMDYESYRDLPEYIARKSL